MPKPANPSLRPRRRGVLVRLGLGTALAALLLLGVFSRGERNPDLPPIPRLSEQTLICTVDAKKILRKIPSTLFGTNLEWFNHANGIANDDGKVSVECEALAREQGISTVRFPGGTLSDFYDWRDGIGVVARRPIRDHPTDSGSSPNVFGTPELLRFCRAIGAQPLVTVNAGTGSAKEAAAWVSYCNLPGNLERISDGLPEPAGIGLWEIGNELYLPGNPTDKRIITVSPEVYADRFIAFADAMRRVDPSIKLMAIGTANSSNVGLPYPDWTETVLKKSAQEIDYISVHNSYFPLVFGLKNLGTKEVYQAMWAAPEAVDRSLRKLDALIAQNEKGRHIEIAVTEWGTLFSFDPKWIDHVKTLGSSIYLARLMQVYMAIPRVTVANYFKFTDRSMMGWVGYDFKPKVPFRVIELFTHHFGNVLVDASVESPVFSVNSLGVMQSEAGVPEVTVVASLDSAGSKLYVNFINRSWDVIHQIKLDTGTLAVAPTATTWALSSPLPTDNNGRDLPEEVPTSMYREPTLSTGLTHPINIEQGRVDIHSPIRIPPFSMVTLEIDIQA